MYVFNMILQRTACFLKVEDELGLSKSADALCSSITVEALAFMQLLLVSKPTNLPSMVVLTEH